MSLFLRTIQRGGIGLAFLLLAVSQAWSGDKNTRPYWVYFKDKGFSTSTEIQTALHKAEANLTVRARERRGRVMASGIVEYADLLVSEIYVNRIVALTGNPVRHPSRWLNAVSLNLRPDQIPLITDLPFVRQVAPVRSFLRSKEEAELPNPGLEDRVPPRDYQWDYGGSLRQNQFLNAPELHDRGYRGQGRLIGVLDAGFNNLDHNCFQNLQVLAMWDFINNDADVGDGDDLGRGDHGTRTLSIMAAFDPGAMIGIAPEAVYVLAKTENTEWERPVEEDDWVAGIEWMDELGVEVVNSSLSYIDWYQYEDMDGQTAVCTIAAERAYQVGMVVVTSMGNNGVADYPHNKMGSPADAPHAISVGATTQDSSCANFSSQGPTADGRIKPEVTTIGVSVRIASAVRDDQYGGGAGTSFSAPAISGLCALILQANPYLTPGELREALMAAGDNAQHPDTLLGWGIPNGLRALDITALPRLRMVIPLHSGWNLISHNLILNLLDVPEVFRPLVERGLFVMVRDDQGRFYNSDWMFNNIPFWNRVEGYQVNLREDAEVVFEGQLCDYTKPLRLREGWSATAYLPNFNLNVRDAFRDLIAEGVIQIVKDEWGRFYHRGFDFSNLAPLEPGRGYQVNLTQEAEWIIDRVRQVDAIPSVENQVPPVWRPAWNCEYNMSVLFIAAEGIQDGDRIFCWNEASQVTGQGVFEYGLCGMAIWGEAKAPFPQVKLIRDAGGEESKAALKWIEGDPEWMPNGFAAIEISTDQDKDNDNLFKMDCFPNPFNNQIDLNLTSLIRGEPVEIEIFDLTGRKVYNNSLSLKLDRHLRFNVDASNWSGGGYLIRVKQGTCSQSKLIQLTR
ncbi:MAG: S8/S53 family peptidase [Calditrichota bacterium]